MSKTGVCPLGACAAPACCDWCCAWRVCACAHARCWAANLGARALCFCCALRCSCLSQQEFCGRGSSFWRWAARRGADGISPPSHAQNLISSTADDTCRTGEKCFSEQVPRAPFICHIPLRTPLHWCSAACCRARHARNPARHVCGSAAVTGLRQRQSSSGADGIGFEWSC